MCEERDSHLGVQRKKDEPAKTTGQGEGPQRKKKRHGEMALWKPKRREY